MMRRKVKQLFAAGMALAVLATNLTPLSFAAEQPDAEPAAAASGDMYGANAILDLPTDWEYIGCSWSSDYATATFNYRVEKNGHEKSVTVNSEKHEKSPTCTEAGETVYTATVLLGAPDALIRTETETVEVPKLEHNYPAKPKSIRFDGLSDLGYKPTAVAIYECTRCGQTKTEEVTDLTYVELKKATCVEKGEGYWVASAGGRTEESALVHPRTTDHDFTKKDAVHVTFAFAEDGKTAVATIQCAHCDATTTETVTCTAEVTTPATCTKMGTTTYTATCGTASKTTTRQDVAMADHEYSATVEWVGTDFMKGKVTYECTQCGPDDEGHFKYEDVDAVVKVVKKPTCLEDGVERHLISASIDGVEVATMVEDIKLPALGHSYDNSCDVQWDDSTYKTATLTWECDNEGCDVNSEGHFKSETLTAVEKVTKPATCTDTGRLLHEVSYEFGGETMYLRETTTIPALGHDFTQKDADHVTFAFAEDGKTAVATIRCAHCDATTTENVTCTAEVTTPATCTKMGTTTYTATCGTASETTTRQDVAMADHEYSATVEWVGTDFMKGRVTYECTQCGPDDEGHFKYDDVDAVVKVVKEPTCLEDGEERHFISASIDGVEVAQKMETVKLPALGHNYNSATVDWVGTDFMKGKVTYECTRCYPGDEGHFKYDDVDAVVKVVKEPTCLKDGEERHFISASINGVEVAQKMETVKLPALGHDFTKTDADHVTFAFAEDGKTAVATIRCARCDETTTETVTCTAKVTTPATCTEKGTTTYTATCGTASETTTRQDVPALGHSFTNYVYNGDATCDGDGTETAKCDRCDVTDTRTAVATAGCDLHTVDGAKVCAVCGKVNGQPKLAAAEASADVNASTIGVHLVVRVGTLPTGQKVITVAFLNNDGQAVRMFGTQKIHVSLAQLKAALGDTEGTGFEHTLTRVNTANGEKQNVGFTVENGTVNFDAAFNGSTACILLVD